MILSCWSLCWMMASIVALMFSNRFVCTCNTIIIIITWIITIITWTIILFISYVKLVMVTNLKFSTTTKKTFTFIITMITSTDSQCNYHHDCPHHIKS